MPKASVRWTAKASSSVNDPGSTRSSIRSRALSLPFGCCLSSGSPPRCMASYLRLRNRLIWRSDGEGLGSLVARVAMGLATRPRPVLAEHVAQHAAHLSYGGIGPQRRPHRRQEILPGLSGATHVLEA